MSTDYIKIKAELLVEGVRASNQALRDVGSKFKEQNHGLFGWDFENHIDTALPDDFLLPDGTVVQFRLNSRSKYNIQETSGELQLFCLEDKICGVQWINRPKFYSRKTSSGDEMIKIGQIGGEDCLFFCYQNYCSHFSSEEQCLFCNLVSTSQAYNSVLKKKDIESIGEVAKVAWDEGMVNHILLTGGCFSSQKETELVTDIVKTIRKHTGLERIPGTVLPSPAKNDDIIKYYDSGIKAIGYSMEIWDEKLYNAICPGKSKTTSHKEFLVQIEKAVKIFGNGNVFCVLVMGLEPSDTFLNGIKTLSEIGASIVPFVWSPNPGSKLAGHRAPSAEWYINTIYKAAEIVIKSGASISDENHCYRCDGNSLLHDVLRNQLKNGSN
ncbi:MAG: radical SAM protein [Candidatus Aadella gelida]|nr:radical SAM protein [Candidatus Aadella gelida]